MKQKHIVHFISSLQRGGAEQVLINLVQGLADDGYRQTVLFIHDGPHRQNLQAMNITCHRIKGVFFSGDPFFLFRLLKILRMLKPDLLHTSLWRANITGRFVAKLLSIPIVHAYHNKAEYDGRWRNALDWLTRARSVHAIAASRETAHSLALKGLKSEKITVIFNGIKQEIIPHLRESQKFIIGMVARFHSQKNHLTLLKALARLKEKGLVFKAVFLGDSPSDEMLTFIEQAGLQDHVSLVLGKGSAEYLSLFDCFVLPSLSEGGISLALQEAMAAGLPCIISPQTNVAGLIEDGINGFVVPALDDYGLALAIERLMQDPELAKKIGAHGQKTVRAHCSVEKMVADYKAVFADLILRNQA